MSALGDLGPTPIILYNGSLVIEPGMRKIVAHRQIDPAAATVVMTTARRFNADLFIYAVSDDKAEAGDELESWETVRFHGTTTPPAREFNGMPVQQLADERLDTPVTAMLVLLKPQEDDASLKALLEDIDGISITSSGHRYIEIRPRGSSKAAGMEDVIRSLNLQQQDVLAVGDNDNDVELLEWAGIGIAVQGASPAAMAASDYISRFGAEQAAIEVLDLVRRAKRLHRTKRER